MSPRDLVYVGHMLDMTRKATDKTTKLGREAFDRDENLRLALTHLVQVIGEAARHVSREFCDAHPEIPPVRRGGDARPGGRPARRAWLKEHHTLRAITAPAALEIRPRLVFWPPVQQQRNRGKILDSRVDQEALTVGRDRIGRRERRAPRARRQVEEQ